MRNQGLPLSTIVLAALVILVLVVVAGVFMGAFGKAGKTMGEQAYKQEYETFKQMCIQACQNARETIQSWIDQGVVRTDNLENDLEARSSSLEYCMLRKTFGGKTYHCYDVYECIVPIRIGLFNIIKANLSCICSSEESHKCIISQTSEKGGGSGPRSSRGNLKLI